MEDAVSAAAEVGYPVVVKAQVLIGGRGKAGGVKLAADEDEVREHAQNILGMDIRGHTVRTLWIEHASDIASEYYASVLLDRSAKQPLVMFSVEGGVDIEEVAERTPGEAGPPSRRPARRASRARRPIKVATDGGADADVVERRGRRAGGAVRGVAAGGCDARGDQPADRDARAGGQGARREGLPRRQRPLPPPREPVAVRQRERRSDRAPGQGGGRPVRQARRRHRHPRQRRRAW